MSPSRGSLSVPASGTPFCRNRWASVNTVPQTPLYYTINPTAHIIRNDDFSHWHYEFLAPFAICHSPTVTWITPHPLTVFLPTWVDWPQSSHGSSDGHTDGSFAR